MTQQTQLEVSVSSKSFTIQQAWDEVRDIVRDVKKEERIAECLVGVPALALFLIGALPLLHLLGYATGGKLVLALIVIFAVVVALIIWYRHDKIHEKYRDELRRVMEAEGFKEWLRKHKLRYYFKVIGILGRGQKR